MSLFLLNIRTFKEIIDNKIILKKIIFDKQRKVLLNLKDVEYIDSSGFAFLIQFSEELKSRQGVVFFSNLSPKIRSLFAITKLDSVFKLYETEQEALKDFYGY